MPSPTIKYFLTSSVPSKGDDPGMTISTMAVDREGDRVIPEGGDFANFMKNPVLCWAHNYQLVPIGGVTGIEVLPGQGVRATWQWNDGDEFAMRVKNAYDNGFVRASSIGFIPTDLQPNTNGGRDITRWEMLELSLCPIPMNPEAVRALKTIEDAMPEKRIVCRGLSADELAAVKAAVNVTVTVTETNGGPDEDDATPAAAVTNDFHGDPGDAQDGSTVDSPDGMPDPTDYPMRVSESQKAAIDAKRGRVLSSANETQLRQAHEHVKACHGILEGVLSKVSELAPDGQPSQMPLAANDSTKDDEGGDDSGMMALSIDDDFVLELVDGGPRLTMEFEAKGETLIDVDPGMLQEVMVDALRSAIKEQVGKAMARARGQVVLE